MSVVAEASGLVWGRGGDISWRVGVGMYSLDLTITLNPQVSTTIITIGTAIDKSSQSSIISSSSLYESLYSHKKALH